MNECCSKPHGATGTIFQNNLVKIVLVILITLLLSIWAPFLVPFREHFLMYFGHVAGAIVLGLLIGGAIDYYVPREYISAVLSHPKKRTVFYAVGLGTLASACSCGILALSIELYRKGASTSAVVSFLLASPWANLPLTFVLVGLFGLSKALFIIGSAVIIALTTGLIFQVLEKYSWVERNPNTVSLDKTFSIAENLKTRFSQYQFTFKQMDQDVQGILKGTMSLGNMVLGWILVGMALAGAIGAYLPHDILRDHLGPTFNGMLLTLLAATVIEVCSEGTAPLAFELYRQTLALGNSFVFLMAGVVTDYTEIGLLWQNIGRRTAVFLPIITVPQVLLFGLWANYLFK